MYKGKTIAVIVPAYQEERLIGKVISTTPGFVDAVIVINDASTDGTKSAVERFQQENSKIILINHLKNEGLGKSLIDGYQKSLELGYEITAVMAGDAQMDPDDLASVVDPVVAGSCAYAKGNRLLAGNTSRDMPLFRLFGNALLTLLTKFATGYWGLIDPQCGYTAISRKALQSIGIERMTKKYGYNAHLLYLLNMKNFRVCDIEVRSVYGLEKSKIKLYSYIPKTAALLAGLFLKRMTGKYLVREFHPLVFFYLMSFFNIFFVALPLLVYMALHFDTFHQTSLIIFCFALMMGFFSFFFGMWLDMEDNKKLQ